MLASWPEELCRKPSAPSSARKGRKTERLKYQSKRQGKEAEFLQEARKRGRDARHALGVRNQSIPCWNNKALQEKHKGRQKKEEAFNQ